MTDRRDRHTGPDARGLARRRLLTSLAATGGTFAAAVALPREWTRPLVDSVVVPLHAQASEVPIIGTFSTGAVAGFAGPAVQSILPLGYVAVGNVIFLASWTVAADGFVICGQGILGGVEPFGISGSGGRTENDLDDYVHPVLVGGQTFQITSQVVNFNGLSDQINFLAEHGDEVLKSVAPAGSFICNVTVEAQLSSPYPDPDRA